jgi:hypothetical protein
MYLKRILDQMCIDGFNSPFGFPIDENNRWVQLAAKIPWDKLEDTYANNFKKDDAPGTGNVALPFRVALGALIIRQVMGLSDRDTVKTIQENPYLQYFLGMPKYSSEKPFDPSMMVHFRKRISLDSMKEINEEVVKFQKKLLQEKKVTSEPSSTGQASPKKAQARSLVNPLRGAL